MVLASDWQMSSSKRAAGWPPDLDGHLDAEGVEDAGELDEM
jgi:hypothetical protein